LILGVNRVLAEAVNGGNTRIAGYSTNRQEVRQEVEKEAQVHACRPASDQMSDIPGHTGPQTRVPDCEMTRKSL
jgi:hypothetical protein